MKAVIALHFAKGERKRQMKRNVSILFDRTKGGDPYTFSIFLFPLFLSRYMDFSIFFFSKTNEPNEISNRVFYRIIW